VTQRLIIVSNRLPVTVRVRQGELHLIPSAGGLATGLRGCHERHDGLWIGWPGDVSGLGRKQRADLNRLLSTQRIAPVYLSREEVKQSYEGFSNAVIWALFHYMLDRIPLDSRDWDAYRRVNERFAEAVVEQYQPGDLLWVRDYQLMVIEIRYRGVNKANVVDRILRGEGRSVLLVAFGDDRTDEEMFAALPPNHISIQNEV
jgi:trehalose 6-phosphate synthase/phosphatase